MSGLGKNISHQELAERNLRAGKYLLTAIQLRKQKELERRVEFWGWVVIISLVVSCIIGAIVLSGC